MAALQLGCSSVSHKAMLPEGPTQAPRKIAIYFDGTHNDEASDTNVKKLHSLVSLQDRQGLATLWIEGVGTGIDLPGMALGYGTSTRVRLAYEFLLHHYRAGDQIYIFGFSRGAWNARVLTSMLFNAGLPKWPGHTASENADTAFSVFKGTYRPSQDDLQACDEVDRLKILDHAKRRAAVQRCLQKLRFEGTDSVSVDVLGLWDTVEALGFPDWGPRILHKLGITPLTVDIDLPNRRYGDQLCNVRLALQALSIDDNREWIFTPLPLVRQHLLSGCPTLPGEHILSADGKVRPGRLKEVWFSGAHSDVGGGYATSMMSGVSLNWMLEELVASKSGLIPGDAKAKVRQDPYGSSHDPEAGLPAGIGYHAISRNIAAWPLEPGQRMEFVGSLCVHPTVFARRRALAVQSHENGQLRLLQPQTVCLEPDLDDGFSKPQRMREVVGKEQPCDGETAKAIRIEVAPHCQAME